jgi:transglutaminase-like putative cysteine protease
MTTTIGDDGFWVTLANAGGRLVSVDYVEVEGLGSVPSVHLQVEDNAQAIKLLNMLAIHDSRDSRVQDLAATIRASARDELSIAQSLWSWIKDNVPFIEEQRETFYHPLIVVRGGGDCDDHARALAALALASGIPAEVVGVPGPDGRVKHAATILLVHGQWRWAETTVDAQWDEHPLTAAKRLGLQREDIGT